MKAISISIRTKIWLYLNKASKLYNQRVDLIVFFLLSGIGKKSRSMFMEMDANAAKSPAIISAPQTPDIKKNSQVSPMWPPPIKTKVILTCKRSSITKRSNI